MADQRRAKNQHLTTSPLRGLTNRAIFRRPSVPHLLRVPDPLTPVYASLRGPLGERFPRPEKRRRKALRSLAR